MLDKLNHLSKRLVARETAASGRVLPATHIFQRDEVTTFEAIVYNPVICLILQGKKELNIGAKSVSLVEGDALLVSHDLPLESKITEATSDTPYRALIISLDLGILRSLYEQVGEA